VVPADIDLKNLELMVPPSRRVKYLQLEAKVSKRGRATVNYLLAEYDRILRELEYNHRHVAARNPGTAVNARSVPNNANVVASAQQMAAAQQKAAAQRPASAARRSAFRVTTTNAAATAANGTTANGKGSRSTDATCY
jgi:hypothetical protein